VSGPIVEAGIYFLLLFTPFAFGGVEGWAKGVIQIVSGVVVAAWALERPAHRLGAGRSRRRRGRIVLWGSMAVFVALVLAQLVPLPSSWIATLSPGTYDLYARTLPGYADGRPFDPDMLPGWLLTRFSDRIPASPEALAEAGTLTPPVDDMFFPTTGSTSRPLSVVPFETRQRLTLLLCYIGLFAVVASYYRSRERLARLLGMAVFSAFAVSLFGIIQKFTWNGKLFWVRESDYFSPFGPFVNKNTYAAFAGTLLPVAVCMGLVGLSSAGIGRRDALPRLFLWGFAAVTIGGGVAFSLSRAGMLAVCLSMLILGSFVSLYMGRRRDLAVIALVAVAGVLFLVWLGPEQVIERVGTLSEGQNVPTLMSRFHAWERALGMIADRPLVGSGLGTFRFAFVNYAPVGSVWWTHLDNEYIELICETGALGGAIFLLGLGAFIHLVARPGRLRGNTERYAWVGIVSGMIALLFHSALSSNLQVPANGMLITILGGALLAMVGSRQR